ncbi:MAG: methyltransferase domain-containing protein [Eubacteriales bacterium]|nr:methyltransferase domain-containing protein [Eubacteriales bacterium]MDD3880841.1 methyltransferase domain-containing protein [Eubacteriales bacterium]MDD4511792.1 methyltransferase domain-containing protein [Eubacteriales bacterium]
MERMERLDARLTGELPASRVRKLMRFCPIPEKSSLLDMTVGMDSPLRGLHRLRPGVALSGICGEFDYFRGIRNELPDVELIFGKPSKLPWDDETFDAVNCSMLAGSEENGAALFDAMRVLKSGGRLMIYVRSAPNFMLRALHSLKNAQEDENGTPISVREAQELLSSLGAESVSVHRVSMTRALVVGVKPQISEQ